MGERKVRGLTIRHDEGRDPKFRVSFTYKGINCRETLKLAVTPANERYAARLVGEIYNAIERGTFRYADYFPDSPKLAIFGSAPSGATIRHYVENYIELCERKGLKESTLTGYRKMARVLGSILDIRAVELTPAILKNWILSQVAGEGERDDVMARKTLRNRLALLRPAMDEAVTDGLLETNPVRTFDPNTYIRIAKATPRGECDPYSPEEVAAIIDACRHEQERNLTIFAFETGLRTGELIGLRWDDVDWVHGKIRIERAYVEGVLTTPKTGESVRDVELSQLAVAALKNQMLHTQMHRAEVFMNPRTMERWKDDDAIRKFWKRTSERAKVRYRKPYNTRHTFATRHISEGNNLWWIASQMGHTSPEMLFRHYGTFLKEYSHDAQRKNLDTKRKI